MNDVKTWADIDASPLLQLPPEQRKKLHDANDERFRTFWAECFLTAQTPGRGEDAWNSVDFCDAFLDAFPDPSGRSGYGEDRCLGSEQ